MKKKVAIIFGTRPEALKLVPVVHAFKNNDGFETKVIVTAQHKDMLYQVLDLFEIKPDFDLDVMRAKQSLFELSSRLLGKLQEVLLETEPDLVIVQGDTTTTFITALAAFYLKIPVAHVEAGLRSHDKHHPFPEEMNRILTSDIADLHFAPTKSSEVNLLKQGIEEKDIFVVGNTIIDSLKYILKQTQEIKDYGNDYILVTAHRRENWGSPIENLCNAIKEIGEIRPNERFVFSVHLNPIVKDMVKDILGNNSNIKLIEPVDYKTFIQLINQSKFVLSDSGGIQEEAPALAKPVLVFRKTTERPEGIKAGVVKLVGSNKKKIVEEVLMLIDDKNVFNQMSQSRNLYGDGTSSKQIVEIVRKFFKQ